VSDIEPILNGNRLALARLLTQIENETAAGMAALNTLFPYTGRAHLIGVTGAPGTGKSSLVNRLAYFYRHPPTGDAPPLKGGEAAPEQAAPRKVAVVAVDPTSPFSGGAVLGDRIRMRDLSGDPGVFIRSMASRGSLGGLARATAGLVAAFDAAGFDTIIIETVGAGQAEVDIAKLAHTTLVLEAPGLGDDVQAIKAGILEIADILVINKADRPGVENTERALKNMLNLAHPGPRIFQEARGRYREWAAETPAPGAPELALWMPLIRRTVATEGEGIPELAAAIAQHRSFLEETGDLQKRERIRLQSELDLRIQDALVTRWQGNTHYDAYRNTLEQLVRREISPAQAVARLVN